MSTIAEHEERTGRLPKPARCWFLTDLFYSDEYDDIVFAQSICGECEGKEACFARALANKEPYGVWGGELFRHGKIHSVEATRKGRRTKDLFAPITPKRTVPKQLELLPETA